MHVIPLAAEKIEKKILNIPDHWGEIADQEFDPESIHAQSGIAVAEALESTLQFVEQELAEEQQAQARENIGAVSTEEVDTKLSAVAFIDENDNESITDASTYLATSDIVDNLESTSAERPLSANQGRILNKKIAAIGGGASIGNGCRVVNLTDELSALGFAADDIYDELCNGDAGIEITVPLNKKAFDDFCNKVNGAVANYNGFIGYPSVENECLQVHLGSNYIDGSHIYFDEMYVELAITKEEELGLFAYSIHATVACVT